MENYLSIIFLLLALGLSLSLYKAKWIKFVRVGINILSCVYFAYWFFQKSIPNFRQNSMAVQVINTLPQTVDFYLLSIHKEDAQQSPFSEAHHIHHLGKIRSNHYLLEYLNAEHSPQYWVIGYIGKKNMVYFSEHFVLNKNIDQIVEVNNYGNIHPEHSIEAEKAIIEYQMEIKTQGVWITLSLLLLFLNVAEILRSKKHH